MKTHNIFGISHFIFFIIFITNLHFIGLFNNNVPSYELLYYLFTHFIIFMYLIIFLIGLIWIGRVGTSEIALDFAISFNDKWLTCSFISWIILKGYLVSQYGVSAFKVFRKIAGDGAIYQFTFWEISLMKYAQIFAEGACLIYVIKLFIINGYWKKLKITMPFIIFISIYIITHEPLIGPRRFILILFIISILAAINYSQKSILKYFYYHWRKFLCIVIIVMGITVYYQQIRKNYLSSEIAYSLQSDSIFVFTKGIVRAMLPLSKEKKDNLKLENQITFFRSGPFEIMYKIVKKIGEGHPGTNGKILKAEIQNITPRLLLKDKKVVWAEEILYNDMAIGNNDTKITSSDMANSILAHFIADFGVLSIFIPPIILLIAIIAFSYIMRFKYIVSPPIVLYCFYSLINFCGNSEGSLVSVIIIFRDFITLIIISISIYYILYFLQYGIRNYFYTHLKYNE